MSSEGPPHPRPLPAPRGEGAPSARIGVLACIALAAGCVDAPGTWRIVFDKGSDVCDCPAKP
jgi:hypothetical protein